MHNHLLPHSYPFLFLSHPFPSFSPLIHPLRTLPPHPLLLPLSRLLSSPAPRLPAAPHRLIPPQIPIQIHPGRILRPHRHRQRPAAGGSDAGICSILGRLHGLWVYRCVGGLREGGDGVWGEIEAVWGWIEGVVLGLVFGFDFVWRSRSILKFPIVQRPLFYGFKRVLASSVKQALKISAVAFFCSTLFTIFLPDQFKRKSTMGQYIVELVYFFVGTSAISICWELSHHLLEVLHTRRCSFAPAQGSATAETNPCEVLLEALEQSYPRSLLQYLAYLDLCMVSESNVEPWRRAAFFEETGETYRRIVSVFLRPLEQLTAGLGEGLEGVSPDKSDLVAQQMSSTVDICADSKIHEAFDDLQLCSWCARSVATLTARSNLEDRYGVAQLTSCNTAVVSTLLSTLVAVEACLGKKTNPQPARLTGPASIRWSTTSAGRRDGPTTVPSKKRGGMLYGKAYAMADVLRTSIYQIVSAFEADMHANVRASFLEKNWIMDGKPLYGTREILVQKLSLFLEFRAN